MLDRHLLSGDRSERKNMKYDEIIAVLNSIGNASKSIMKDVNIQELGRVSEVLKAIHESNASEKTTQKQATAQLQQVSKIWEEQYRASGLTEAVPSSVLKQVADMQAKNAMLIERSAATKMLEEIRRALVHSEIQTVVNVVGNALESTKIEAADMAFLKTSPLMEQVRAEISMPSPVSTALRQLNKTTAKRIASNEELIYDTKRKRFYDESNLDATADATEMNVLCTGADILEDAAGEEIITETELMNFMTYLSEKPMLAMKNDVGAKIYNAIRETKKLINFDKQYYYHARSKEREAAPYIWGQMQKAPTGLPKAGRFNHVGKAHFYFADTKEGAENEVRMHMSKEEKEKLEIQIMRLKTQRDIKLIDLSGSFRRGYKTFLKYIRFGLSGDTSQMPRVYLIPSFVSDCCKDCGIEGIKYYGGAGYSNYVSWEDGYFTFDGNILK